MAEVNGDLGRALGAGTQVKVGNQTYNISPLTLRQLTEVQQAALLFYKRQYLGTFAAVSDIVPNSNELLTKAVSDLANMGVRDIPAKESFDVSGIDITHDLKTLLAKALGSSIPNNDASVRQVTAAALDQELITSAQVESCINGKVRMVKLPYDAWWATGTYEGMAELVSQSLQKQHPEMTADKILEWQPTDLAETSRNVEALSAPDADPT